MYFMAKAFQATGLAVMAWGFVKSYPNLMSRQIIMIAGILFIIGWIIQTYMLKK
jgi:hypothetical protein